MARTDDDREFRLRPPKPRVMRNEGAAWSNGFKLLMQYARSSRKAGIRGVGGKGKAGRPYHQRCAVRVTYLKNKVRGQWKAHGRYLARETATFENDLRGVGFSDDNKAVDIGGQLAEWQAAGDQQLWKLIISPEFGDRVDLPRLTHEMIKQMEKDLGTKLEWVAAEHHNTEHSHVHVVIRGMRDDGETLRMSREYVQARDSIHCRGLVHAPTRVSNAARRDGSGTSRGVREAIHLHRPQGSEGRTGIRHGVAKSGARWAK